MREVVLLWEGRRNHLSLRAQLRESVAEAGALRAGSRGPCVRATCKAKSQELITFQATTHRGRDERREMTKAEMQISALKRQLEDLERTTGELRRRRRCERSAVDMSASLQDSLDASKKQQQHLQLAFDKAQKEDARVIAALEKKNAALEVRCGYARQSSKESAAQVAALAAEHVVANERAVARALELERETAAAAQLVREKTQAKEKQKVRTELLRLQVRSAELTAINHREARAGVVRGEYHRGDATSERTAEELVLEKPKVLSPASKVRRQQLVRNSSRMEEAHFFRIYEVIGEDCDNTVLANVLEALDKIDPLMETEPFWKRRILQAQALMDVINETWGAALAARMKADYLLSNRDLDAMRIDYSFILVNNVPRHRPLLVNPHSTNDTKQRVMYPEPITKRTGGWADVIKGQAEHFGLKYNEDHEDATERDWDSAVQMLVARDAALFESPETFGPDRPLQLVLGFDGAADFCHVCVRAIDYNPNIAKESEMKGVGLSVAIGNDHNPNLALQFKTLGVAINRAVEEGGSVTLMGRSIPYKVDTCLDYSASRSMNALRSNSAPHSKELDPHMEISAPKDATYKKVAKLLQKKLPWREFNPDIPLNHISNGVFPFTCSRCPYTAASEEEEATNIANALALDSLKGVAGTKATAARVKRHCEAHDDTMEFQSRVVRVHPRDNIVDLLHAMDINLPSLLLKFSIHDPVLFAENPELPHSLTQYYTFIGCPFDLLGEKSWFHGSVWHYDFVQGANGKSPGLDMNMLMCCLICFGIRSVAADAEAGGAGASAGNRNANQVVDDIDDDSESDDAEVAQPADDEVGQILRRLFGHNITKVRTIFEATCAYGETFESINDEWTETAQTYKEERALRTYRGGLRLLKGMKAMSNSRCKSHYLPLVAYVLPQQMAKIGDAWPYSTRAVEGRGGRLKRISRKTVCFRKRSKEVWKSVKNLKLATTCFKKSAYNSSRTLQMFRIQAAQEESSHAAHGRSRLTTTGRNTLKRNLPKWNEAERPEIGKLLDPVVLAAMVLRASVVFATATTFETEAMLEMEAELAASPTAAI